ncbi:Rieske 2Fe-2S domain-containing protein [Belliella sp. R4-6]|uniref:Rieske 2Fe-2S domain-containing protein n=1 Tax=Belliella alkalica TaxID=1730871 RepID=A0ABS9VAS2_9BACT|nr:Rieske 2Fe-2S domain-containing protein [Belliella alkalica]MCH7412973.1 Rieske 2Fe-2S domain-containing protein [Belliella alkalica]
MKNFTLGENRSQVMDMIADRNIKVVLLGSTRICISRVGEVFYAFETHCPHRKAELKQGMVTSFGEIVCPLHEYRFDMQTGDVKSGSCGELKTYRVELTENGLKIFI